ncbi:MAG: pilus assembly protein PilM [Candidatus Paceibacterota bacterium]|jgi:type IV pilus assembly protein PilM
MPPSFGLDISDESIKFAKLIAVKGGIRVGQHGEKKIPPGIIESGKIKDTKKLEEVLLSLKKEIGLTSVRVSLPEEQVYLFRDRLDKEGLKNVREGIELTLEEYIPIPAQDAIFDYEILNDNPGGLELQVAAIPKNVIESYLSVFKDSNIAVQSCELEAQAIARAVVKRGDKDTYMIVDFGQTRTGIFIVSSGVVVFTSTFDIGGATIVKTIEKSFNVNYEEADKMKKQYGMMRNAPNKEIFSVILNIVSIVRDEIAKHFLYWHTHPDEQGKERPAIKKIILCGGESNLIGLTEYLSVSIKTPVELANVWVNINDTAHFVPEMSFNQSLTFAAAFGLALGDFDYD